MLCFNPTLVRLKEATGRLNPRVNAGFNPTLVRLKVMGESIEAAEYVVFQSHTGSIKS